MPHHHSLSDPVPRGPHGVMLHGVDCDGRYVLGFPMHVAVTVCSAHPGSYARRLPLAGWAGNAGAIGVRLVNPVTRAEVVASHPVPVVIPEIGTSTFSLAPGACRRMLVDVSSFLPPDLAAGRYDITITYVAPPDRVESHPIPVTLAAPNAVEKAEIDKLLPAVERAGSWGRWTNLPPREGDVITLPRGALDPLRFNRIMRYLMYGPEELAVVSPSIVDVLHGVYEPESHAILAELYAARRDVARFTEEEEIVRTSFPGLAWWMDEIASGHSELAFVRAMRPRMRSGG